MKGKAMRIPNMLINTTKLSIMAFLVYFFASCMQSAQAGWELFIDNEKCGLLRSMDITSAESKLFTVNGLECINNPDPPVPPDPEPENVRIVDPGYGYTFLPNCVNGAHWHSTGCHYTGSMRHGEPIAIRVDNSQGSTSSFREARISRSETGDSNITYEITVSSIAGNFDVASLCKGTSIVKTAYEGAGQPNACPVKRAVIYVNVRTLRSNVSGKDVSLCGSQLICRPKVFGNLIY